MSAEAKSKSDRESPAPYGTETPRPRWVLALWIVLCTGWLIFLLALARRDSLQP